MTRLGDRLWRVGKMALGACVGAGLVLLAVSAAGGCARHAAGPKGKLMVGVGVLPLAYIAERVGDGRVQTLVLVGPGQEPHTYEPMPRQVGEMAHADLYFSVQLPLETRLIEKIASMNPRLKVVDVRQGVVLRQMTPAEEAAEEGHEHAHAHGGGEPDPHVWLSPANAKRIAANMARALSEADAAHAAEYQRNLDAFQSEMDALDAAIARTLAPFKGREFMVFHPAFGYFADAYGLKEMPVEVEGKDPGPRQLAEMIKLAKERNIRIIFVQPQFSPKSAAAIAEAIGGAVIPMDDLAYDYVKNLQDMAGKVQQAVEREQQP